MTWLTMKQSWLAGGLAALLCACAGEVPTQEVAEASSALEGAQYERFRAFDESGQSAYGIEGILPPNEELAYVYRDMDESERKGLAAWHLFGAYRGKFLRRTQLETSNASNMLRVLDSRSRGERFQRTGLVNDPDCRRRSEPDEFGLYLDDCPRDPYSSGAVGLRLRPNPDFDMDAWLELGEGDAELAAERWLEPPKNRFEWKSAARQRTTAVEPPYEVVMTCTVCHAAPNPIDPPADPNSASWKQIVFAFGNQFFKEGAVFGDSIPRDDFLSQAVGAQHPGTSDTSRMANDHIFNPNTINSIFNLAHRPLHPEKISRYDEDGREVWNADIVPGSCQGDTCDVNTFRVLKDGGDSSGPSGAALRVYLNIGACFDQLVPNIDPVDGLRHPTEPDRLQTPISRRQLEEECPDYQRLLPYTQDIINYLSFVTPYRLSHARGGSALVKPWNDAQMQLGRQVFAEECASCHSSLQPEYPTGEPTAADTAFEREFATWSRAAQEAWLYDAERIAWFKERVDDEAFFETNFLSDDRRYPLSLIGTNPARALATNASKGHVWEEYASLTSQTLPAVDIPVIRREGLFDIEVPVRGPEGRGYYRTPSLWGVWATAPYLNNNGLGLYNGGWQVPERLAAYEDGMQRLLGVLPRQRKMARTTRFTALTNVPLPFTLPTIPGIDPGWLRLGLPIPPGVPVAAVANMEPMALLAISQKPSNIPGILLNPVGFFTELAEEAIPAMDFVEDKGHTFGRERTLEEKRALIEFLKAL
jgi:cytochrome c5